MKDVIKSGGEWVSSLQIEELIEQYPGVKEAAVIGIPDEKWGERPIAFVVADSDHGGDLHEADIKAHLQAFAARGVIPKFGIPEKIEFVDALAKTSVGKIDKKTLRQKYGTTR
jgi:fatty-acyl-CoA synthase